MMLTIHNFAASLVFLLLFFTSVVAAARPNVVLIMADDFGYESIGANGGSRTRRRTSTGWRPAACGSRSAMCSRCVRRPACSS